MLMRAARARCAAATAGMRLLLVGGVRGSFARFTLRISALEVRGDRLRLRTAATRTAAAALVTAAVSRRLGAALGAVRHRALGDVVRLLAHRRFATRLGNRVGDRLGDELHRAAGVIVARDRYRDQIRIGVRVDDRDDRDAKLVRLGDGDLLLLRVDDE